MNRDPRRPGGSIDERVEQRPIGDRVAAVEHSFRFAVGRCDRSRVEMVAPDHDGRFDFAAFHQIIHGHAKLGALAVAEPANPRGQSLKLNPLSGELHPARQSLVLGK